MQLPIPNRSVAGQNLAALLHELRGRRDVIVLGLPYGGIPIAFEIAQALDVELDVLVPPAQQERFRRQERLLRGERPQPRLRSRTIILADDGMTEGRAMRQAVDQVYREAPARIIVAVPVADSVTLNRLRPRVAECVVLTTPQPLGAIAPFYRDYSAVEERDACQLLRRHWSGHQAEQTA